MISRLFIMPLVALAYLSTACNSAEVRTETKVDREVSDVPKTTGPDYDAIAVAEYVKRRRDLALKLFTEERLNECIKVCEDLLKDIPAAISVRYDLGLMYFQRAAPKIKHYRDLEKKVSELALETQTASGERARKLKVEAENTERQVGIAYQELSGDCDKAVDQFSIYSQRNPSDPRPVDMLWRCYLTLERYDEAYENIERTLNWEGIIKDEDRKSYEDIRDRLKRFQLEGMARRPSSAPAANQVNPGLRGSSNNR